MRYSENLHLNLPEDSDPLEIDKISENFEVLDGAIKEQSKASGYQVGDTLTTWRTDLGEEWLLCNGDGFDPEAYPELAAVIPPYYDRFFNSGYSHVKLSNVSESSNMAVRSLGIVGKKYMVVTVGSEYMFCNVGTYELINPSSAGLTALSFGSSVCVYIEQLNSFAYTSANTVYIFNENNLDSIPIAKDDVKAVAIPNPVSGIK